jgi:hypothetical protein
MLVPRIQETYICRLFFLFFFSEKFGIHEVDFNDPTRPRTPKESAKVLRDLQYKKNSRPLPNKLHIPDASAYTKK